MPFQSDKQKRWMYANEPEIAREWSDRYGAANGGIMDVASDGNLIDEFKNYNKGESVNVPTSFQARSHSTPVNLAYITDDEAGILQALKPDTPHDGPMGIPNYDDWDPDRGYTSGTAMSAMETGSTNAADRREVRASNYGGPKGMAPGAKTKREQEIRGGAQAAAAMGRSGMGGWGGNLLRGIMSIFGGLPGQAMSLLSRINPNKLRGKNPDGSWRTQKEYEDDRTNRRNTKRMNYLSNRKSKGLGYGKKAYANLLGEGYSDTFQDAIERDWELEGADDNYLQNPSKNYLQNIDLSKYDKAPASFNIGEQFLSENPEVRSQLSSNFPSNDGITSLNNERFVSDINPQFQHLARNVAVNEDQMKTINKMAGMYGKVNADAYGTPAKLDAATQKEIFDAAKTQDTKESSGFLGLDFLGGEKADPMKEQEYIDYITKQGYI